MHSRVLPLEERHRVADTPLFHMPEAMDLIVVETPDGTILGGIGVGTAVHVEGVWIAPAHRGRAAVGRQLQTAVGKAVRQRGSKAFIAGVEHKMLLGSLIRSFQAAPVQQYLMMLQDEGGT